MPSRKISTGSAAGRPHKTPLTDQQKLFVREYCVDLDAGRAAIESGYKNKSAGHSLMRRPHIIDSVRRQIARRARQTEIDAERVLCELAMIAFGDPGDMFAEDGTMVHIQDMPVEVRKMISSLDVETRETRDGATVTMAKVRFWNKLEALNMIGKHLGILGSQVEQKHLHLHSEVSNPFLNAPDDLLLQAKSAMSKLQHSVKGNINDETIDSESKPIGE